MSQAPNDIILFHYRFSPNARRLSFYLALRGIQYAECLQPVIMPRPDLEELGVNYRRIPLLSIGRDVYCDTRLILKKLEERHPNDRLGGTTGDHKALERLIQRWTIEAGIFGLAARCLPPDGPVMNDAAFLEDRGDFFGRPWTKEGQKKGRPEALAGIRDAFDLVETTFLADGRTWILGTNRPSLADIEAVWPFSWILQIPDAIPASTACAQSHPKVFAWIQRFEEAVKATGMKPVVLQGAEAVNFIKESDFAEQGGRIDDQDPTKLSGGEMVSAYPTDTGASGKVTGKLVDLTPDEITVAVKTKAGDKIIHVHMPRWGFRIVPAATKL